MRGAKEEAVVLLRKPFGTKQMRRYRLAFMGKKVDIKKRNPLITLIKIVLTDSLPLPSSRIKTYISTFFMNSPGYLVEVVLSTVMY